MEDVEQHYIVGTPVWTARASSNEVPMLRNNIDETRLYGFVGRLGDHCWFNIEGEEPSLVELSSGDCEGSVTAPKFDDFPTKAATVEFFKDASRIEE